MAVAGSSHLHEAHRIVETVAALNPRSVVDIGMGTGKYGFLLRERLDFAQGRIAPEDWQLHLVGVDGCADYVGHQHNVYNDVVVADAIDYLDQTPDRFDVALLLDIIEHLTPANGERLLAAALARSHYAIVTTPRAFYLQEGHANELERHLSWWPRHALIEAGKHVHARVAVATDRAATVALFSTHGRPKLAGEWPASREFAVAIRDRLVPDHLWYRATRRTGPTL